MDGAWPEIPGYELLDELGRGGMGVVYRARRRSDGAPRALKMMLRGRGASLPALARFRIEAEALACLNHPNIIKIRDIGVHRGTPYFAMDYAAGGSLKGAGAADPGPRPAGRSAGLVRTLALAIAHAHGRGMLHRDLKPANVLLTDDGTPVVSDFGLVKFADPIGRVSEMYCTRTASVLDDLLSEYARELSAQYGGGPDDDATTAAEAARRAWASCAARTGLLDVVDPTRLESVRAFLDEAETARRAGPAADVGPPALDDLTRDGSILGSPAYMAPEQARGDLGRIGPRTDVYGLGVILYELIAGAPPFRGGNPFEVMAAAVARPPAPLDDAVPPGLAAICLRCLEKSPDDRYPTADALADDLGRFLDGHEPVAVATRAARPEQAPTPPPPAPTWGTSPAISTTGAQNRTETEAPGPPVATRTWWPFGRRRREPPRDRR